MTQSEQNVRQQTNTPNQQTPQTNEQTPSPWTAPGGHPTAAELWGKPALETGWGVRSCLSAGGALRSVWEEELCRKSWFYWCEVSRDQNCKQTSGILRWSQKEISWDEFQIWYVNCVQILGHPLNYIHAQGTPGAPVKSASGSGQTWVQMSGASLYKRNEVESLSPAKLIAC